MIVAVLGLGAMGSRMARRLSDAGHEVHGWNRTPREIEGIRMATSPREAVATTDVALAMVRDDEASRSVWLDPKQGALAALPADAIAIESSTLSPAGIGQLDAVFRTAHRRLVEAPVVGSRPQADAGQLHLLIGGDAEDLERVAPLLGVLGVGQHHLGPLGTGTAAKLMVNALFGVQVAAGAEWLAAAQRMGLQPDAVTTLLGQLPVASPALLGALGLMRSGNDDPLFPVELVAKDFGYAIGRDDEALPITATARGIFEKAIVAGIGERNLTAVHRLYTAERA